MNAPLGFRIETFQNEYLPAGATRVNAVVTVTATGSSGTGIGGALPGGGRAAEVIIVDCSGSMDHAYGKLAAAKNATAAAISAVRDGVDFAVVAGTDVARMVYPATPSLLPATPANKAAAIAAVQQLRAGGGTAIGNWLRLARQLFGNRDGLRHAILLTDGRDEHETVQQLDAEIAASAGVYVCDCRGVGTDGEVAELRKISTALLGTVDIVADPKDLVADFSAMTTAAMGKSVADVALRLWTPRGATVKFVKQVAPELLDLSGRRTETGTQTGEYPTGSWGGAESRDFHICVEVAAGGVGDVMLAGRVGLVRGSGESAEVLGQGLIKAVWTDDVAQSSKISPEVAHYSGQAELAGVIQEGLAARRDGDLDTATRKLGRAVQIAAAAGNTDTAKLLEGVVDVLDARTGTVRLKSAVRKADEMTLDTRSTKTSRVHKR
ncbi:vWA domain-containing protein [Nocardia seriolae]|uniref:VWA domain-containing protein n=1 Tax=Nocardia seriolae TaxID=37332 RepID=A0ABC9Z1S7_9NOCA|nr:VWA domain-containing protein [Nocardia seriolae]BEK95117.1 VWA domain-containing protein [Nocardia seriolae]GAM49757.1 von Willebrand factor A [Nocardia seriolae]GAP31679.1 VWA domain-containing protein [Nocardia seriolae]